MQPSSPKQGCARREEEEEEETEKEKEVFTHYKIDLKRHVHTPRR